MEPLRPRILKYSQVTGINEAPDWILLTLLALVEFQKLVVNLRVNFFQQTSIVICSAFGSVDSGASYLSWVAYKMVCSGILMKTYYLVEKTNKRSHCFLISLTPWNQCLNLKSYNLGKPLKVPFCLKMMPLIKKPIWPLRL